MHFVGLNLTVPHKLLAVELVDELDESATTWGAVNTISFEAKNESGNWTPLSQLPGPATGEIRAKGYNTDADAITLALQQDLVGLSLAGQRVLLLGKRAGGVRHDLSAGTHAALSKSERRRLPHRQWPRHVALAGGQGAGNLDRPTGAHRCDAHRAPVAHLR